MKAFFKENKKTLTGLWLDRFGGAVFAIMLNFALVKVENVFVNLLATAVSVGFYFYLIYSVLWEKGATDRISADSGKIAPRPHYGIVIALAESAPAILFALVMTVSSFLVNICEVSALGGVLAVSGVFEKIWNIMFQTAFNIFAPTDPSPWAAFGYSFIYYGAIAFGGLFIWAAYLCGYKGVLTAPAFKVKREK